MKYVVGSLAVAWGAVLVTNFRHWVQIMHRTFVIFAERSRSGGPISKLGLLTSWGIAGMVSYWAFRLWVALIGLGFIGVGTFVMLLRI